jgi:16S rRNA (guanine527-N7)-methyltransferase
MIADEAETRVWLRQLPEFDTAAMLRLERLVELLSKENRRQNLVSAASLEEVWRRHIADSAQLLAHVPRGTSPWLDLGTGAGFPGLVIAALRPDREVLLVETRKRRIEWLERACRELELGGVRVLGGRLEDVPSRNVAAISARAFAPLDRLLELSARFSTKDTIWLLPKGRSAQQELDMLRGWNHTFHVEQSLTDPDGGVIVGTLQGRSGRAGGKGKAK